MGIYREEVNWGQLFRAEVMMVDFLQEEFWWLQRLGLPIAGQVGVAVSRWVARPSMPPFDEYNELVPVASLVLLC
jgi:hypothetical protein